MNSSVVKVRVYTENHQIEGLLNTSAGHLSDLLNSQKHGPFLNITDATIMDSSGNLIQSTQELSVNRSHVVIITPLKTNLSNIPGSTDAIHLFIKNKNWAAAFDEARKVISNQPENAEAHLMLGIVLGKMNKLNESLKSLETARKLADNNSDVSTKAAELIENIRI